MFLGLSKGDDREPSTCDLVGCDIAGRIGLAYEGAATNVRRDFNQAWFEGLFIDTDEDDGPHVARVQRTRLGEALMTARRTETAPSQPEMAAPGLASDLVDEWGSDNKQRRSEGYGVVSLVEGSNVALLVPHSGRI